ncbi:disulfide bond formation protein B [Chelonobacter oris]|uniref:disulfide bond formation protein DsbB n=1 Tax=Chelonobacter oris TaxID=505317 RepID=UPI002446DACB|nr:disulfide bond formation protein DsbB [Chelonobacter oris]MDH3000390.1 disulfide bond formation protein B [Chelonobacter oris]
MFNYLKQVSLSRGGWFLLLISCLAFEAAGLYFQHVMKLEPCVMCIYERVAILGIALAALIGLIAPHFLLIRLSALIIGLFSAVQGLLLAVLHTDYQLNPNPWDQCPLMVDFPATLPLNKWFPQVFEAYGSCSELQWSFLGFAMPQWLIVVFAAYVLVLGGVLLSQLKPTRRRQRTLFK